VVASLSGRRPVNPDVHRLVFETTIYLMKNRVWRKRIAIAFCGLSLSAILLAVFFVCALIADIRREALSAIGTALADSLADEQTLRDFYGQIFTDAEVEAILTDHGEKLKITLNSGNDNDRICALILLGEAGVDAASFVPDLIDALDDPNPEVRRQAAFALGEVGADAAPAIESLRTMSKREHERVQPEATKAVDKITYLTATKH